MNKELTPLEALSDLRKDAKNHIPYHTEYLNERLDIIETALKDYEELKKLKLLPYPKINDEEYRRSVIKRLQTVEIIKEKDVNIQDLKVSYSFNEYNTFKGNEYKYLTQEEYDLLKEVLL